MKIKINLLLLLSLFSLSLICSEGEIKSLDNEEKKQELLEDAIMAPDTMVLISSEGNSYSVPFNVVMQSNTIKTAWENDNQETEFSTFIEDKYLKPLLIALDIIAQNKNKLSTKELYERIQDKLNFRQYNLTDLITVFYEAIKLDNDILANTFADYIAQLINPENVNEFSALIRPEHWFLIEKYYHLRSPELHIDSERMLFQANKELTEELFSKYFNRCPQEFNIANIAHKIVYNMNLSIQDLLDYGKDIRVIEYRGKQLLDLSECGLRNLDGLLNITGLENAQLLELKNNQLSHLEDGVFGRFNNLQELSIDNNQLIKLQTDVFSELHNLQRLSIDNNKLSELQNGSFNHLNNLLGLSLDNNKLNEIQDGTFSELNNLDELHLNFNRLSDLQNGVFAGLGKLRMLGLCCNQLSNLQNGVFIGLDSLEILDLHRNPLHSEASREIEIQFKANVKKVVVRT